MGERIKPNTPRPRMPISPNIPVEGIINRVRVTSGKERAYIFGFFQGPAWDGSNWWNDIKLKWPLCKIKQLRPHGRGSK